MEVESVISKQVVRKDWVAAYQRNNQKVSSVDLDVRLHFMWNQSKPVEKMSKLCRNEDQCEQNELTSDDVFSDCEDFSGVQNNLILFFAFLELDYENHT
jgi:hypothetical protein